MDNDDKLLAELKKQNADREGQMMMGAAVLTGIIGIAFPPLWLLTAYAGWRAFKLMGKSIG